MSVIAGYLRREEKQGIQVRSQRENSRRLPAKSRAKKRWGYSAPLEPATSSASGPYVGLATVSHTTILLPRPICLHRRSVATLLIVLPDPLPQL